MKTLITYDTKHGSVKECVDTLKNRLDHEVELVKLGKKNIELDIRDYHTIIIGGSIHAGKLQKSVTNFCKTHQHELLKKNVGLFICTLTPPEKACHYIDDQFPPPIVEHAAARGCFGGAVYYEKMNFFERFIIKKITKTNESFSAISEENIESFAETIKHV